MILKKHFFIPNALSNAILFYIILIIIVSCHGQISNSEQNNSKQIVKIVGDTVAQIDKSIWVIFQDKKNNYWFGSNNSGIYFYDEKIVKQYTTKDGLVSNQIRGIQEDKLGNIYFETPSGVSKFDSRKFISLIPIKSNDNQWKLQVNDLWFKGSCKSTCVLRYDGINLYELEFSEISDKSFNLNHDVYSIYKDTKGNIWFGTLIGGVGCFDGKKLYWIYENELGELEDGRAPAIRSILEDKDGMFWFSNILYKYIIENKNEFSYKKIKLSEKPEKMSLPYYTSAAFDNDTTWMTCYNDGVWKYDGKIFSNYQLIEQGKKALPMFVIKDNKGIIWVGTDNGGVYKFNGAAFVKFKP